MKKVSAYTLMEVIIVMLLSSIVIGATITVFLNVNRFVNSSNENLMNTNEIILFERQINMDIDRSEAFSIQGNEIGVFTEKKRIFYEILDSTIVRNYNYEFDTFAIKVNDYKAAFYEQSPKDCKNLILYIDFYGIEFPILLEKKTDKSILVNFEIKE